MLTKKDKSDIIKNFRKVEMKQMEIDHEDPMAVKWFRFGAYTAMAIAAEIVKDMPEKKVTKKAKAS